jgi:hypothetical protein
MPIHDWTRVDAGIFHDFHQTWVAEIKRELNDGRLPADYYALVEQVTGGHWPDILTLQAPVPDSPSRPQPHGGVVLADPSSSVPGQGRRRPVCGQGERRRDPARERAPGWKC